MSLFRIVYVSDAVGAAADGLLPLIDIIGVSDRNNRRDQLTGVLMRHDGRFLQAIEGARTDLDRLMTRLAADRRHADIRILTDRPVTVRLFPDWAMARIDAPENVDSVLGDLAGPDVDIRAERMLIEARRALTAAS